MASTVTSGGKVPAGRPRKATSHVVLPVTNTPNRKAARTGTKRHGVAGGANIAATWLGKK